jgi:hypothetical protein
MDEEADRKQMGSRWGGEGSMKGGIDRGEREEVRKSGCAGLG